jgi:hypothetical protein
MLIRMDAGAGADYDPELEEMLLRRLDSGPGLEMTPEDFGQLRREIADRLAAQTRSAFNK